MPRPSLTSALKTQSEQAVRWQPEVRCVSEGCKGRARRHRRVCEKCQKRRWREAHPVQDAFANLRHHARQRGIFFGLSLEEFEAIVVPEGYVLGRGRTRDALQVDRIDQGRGYEAGNVRVVTTSENARLERWRQLGIEPGDGDESESEGAVEFLEGAA